LLVFLTYCRLAHSATVVGGSMFAQFQLQGQRCRQSSRRCVGRYFEILFFLLYFCCWCFCFVVVHFIRRRSCLTIFLAFLCCCSCCFYLGAVCCCCCCICICICICWLYLYLTHIEAHISRVFECIFVSFSAVLS